MGYKKFYEFLKMVDISLVIVYYEDIWCYNLKYIIMSYILVKWNMELN